MNQIFRQISGKDWKNDVYAIWSLTRGHAGRLAIAIICSLMLSSINGAIAWLVKDVLDNLAGEKNRVFLMLLPFGVFLLFSLRGFFSFANSFLMGSIGAKIVRTLRQAMYEKLLRLPMSFYSKKSSGSIISRLINDTAILETQIPFTAKNFFVQSTTVVILAFVALYRKWDLAILSFTIIPLIVIVSDRFGRRMKKTSSKTRRLISKVTEIIHETLAGMRIIKSFTMEEPLSKRNESAVSEHYRNVMREVRINEFTSSFMEVIAGSGIAVLLWYGFYLIVHNRMSMSEFLSFVVAVMMMYDPLKRLSRVNNNFQTIRSALNRIRDIFMLSDEKSGSVKKDTIKGDIIYDNVSFRYPGSPDDVLRNVSIRISPGETVAIVGFSGAGKSTLIDLLNGFWDNFSGNIYIDKISLRDFNLSSLRSHIGVVPQDIILFDDTVKNNILFGRPDASGQEVMQAAKTAYAHDFITSMPDGYDTFIGERGVKLSGGQKQRISLARAIIRNPEILILDEATSSLDTESEMKIQKAMEGIMRGRTTIIIAHRLSTIQKADRIIVLEKGRIIQSGHHKELSKQEGTYKELYNLQFNVTER